MRNVRLALIVLLGIGFIITLIMAERLGEQSPLFLTLLPWLLLITFFATVSIFVLERSFNLPISKIVQYWSGRSILIIGAGLLVFGLAWLVGLPKPWGMTISEIVTPLVFFFVFRDFVSKYRK